MFNEHQMSVVTDLNMIGPAINDINYLYIAALTNDYPKIPSIINAMILVPPTELLMQWADGNETILYSGYQKYLCSPDADSMIVALLAALTKRNIILYIPKDDFNIYGMILLNHLAYIYGITCNFMNTRFCIDKTKIPYIISKFYMMDLMTFNDYLESYPSTARLPEWVINKMAMEHPLPGQHTFVDYVVHFNNLNAQNKINRPPVVMVEMIKK